MDILKTVNTVTKLTKDKSPVLLILTGIVGMGASMIMVNNAAHKSHDILNNLDSEEKEITKKDEVLAVAPLYLPAALTFAASTACIIGSYKISAGRIASLATAYTITEHKLEEYQKKVIETIGAEKEEEIQKEIVKDHMRNSEDEIMPGDNPDSMGIMLDGKQWFWDDFSQRYFRGTLREIFDAREEINLRLCQEPVKLNEFYYSIGLDEVNSLDIYEWGEGEKLELRFEPHVCRDGITTCTGIYYDIPIARDYYIRY